MNTNRLLLPLSAALCLVLAACDPPQPGDQPIDQTHPSGTPTVAPSATPTPVASNTPTGEALDMGALSDRENPERLLRFYAAALQSANWDAAAQAWSRDAEVTADTLNLAYGAGGPFTAVIGKGDIESAAGTLFYQAPIVIDYTNDDQPERRGTIVVRRLNDVPGASETQLNWRIDRSTVLKPE